MHCLQILVIIGLLQAALPGSAPAADKAVLLRRAFFDLPGLDGSVLTHLHDGRFKRLTDLGGRVLDDVLA